MLDPTSPANPGKTAARETTMNLYSYLSNRADGLCGWLPQQINRKGNLPATSRRIAWAKKVLSCGEYPSRCLAERLGGPDACGGRGLAFSLSSIVKEA